MREFAFVCVRLCCQTDAAETDGHRALLSRGRALLMAGDARRSLRVCSVASVFLSAATGIGAVVPDGSMALERPVPGDRTLWSHVGTHSDPALVNEPDSYFYSVGVSTSTLLKKS